LSRVPFTATAPDGLALIFSAPPRPEADWVRQVLAEGGFHPEYVPSISTGVFGTTGSVHIFVPAEEKARALAFLEELWAAPIIAPK